MTPTAAARIGSPIRSPAGHAWPFDETERRLAPLLDRVPITRVYDASAVDRLGLPVWGAVTPLARDLTVHAGKGMTAQAARISAVMEAIERVSAEDIDPARVRVASFTELAGEEAEAVIAPSAFDLPFESRYTPELACAWVSGEDVATGTPAWVPRDLVVSPSRDEIRSGTATNGLAAGNTRLEATLHALYEIIERDAEAERVFRSCFGEGEERAGLRLLYNDTLPSLARDWTRSLEAKGLFVGIEEITHDVGVPTFRALVADRAFPGREGTSMAFEGLGCDLDSANAVLRAICEAVQAHTTVLLGARDEFEGLERQPVSRARFLAGLTTPPRRVTFAPTTPPGDLKARLQLTLEGLAAAGLTRCVVVDLTREDLGIPVVRVLVPGACGPHAHTAGRPPLRLLRHLV